MAIDQRAGTKVIKNLRREEAVGSRVDPYPYIGIVKNNLDPTRSGRLQVWIPDLGGDEDEQSNWRTVGYSSPYMGYTTHKQKSTDTLDENNTFESVSHSYGMWMVPPDIGVHVIVLFIAGDPLRGYWISCVNPNLSHHMIPGLAASSNTTTGGTAPVVEFNENVSSNVTNPQFLGIAKPVHKIQAEILRVQGLARDNVRGTTSSSSQRETPSNVFGISTPGRPLNDPADDLNYIRKLNSDTLPPEYHKVTGRKGGHTFVMDDGGSLGDDQLFRLRTAKGHQLLMHDSANTLYIAHADGTSWVELTKGGEINIYAQNGFSVRTQGVMNLHSDTDININAGNNVNIKAGNKIATESARTTILAGSLGVETGNDTEFKVGSRFNVETGSSLSLKVSTKYALEAASILNNSGGTVGVPEIKGFVITDTKLNTIVTVAPTHEPFNRTDAAEKAARAAPKIVGMQPQAIYTGTVDATKNLAGTEVKEPAGTNDIREQLKVNANGTVGTLSKDQTTAYLAQMGKSESGVGTIKGVGNGKTGYECQNEIGFIGKYQFGYQALIDAGYVKSSVTSLAQLDNPNSWTGKDGISDKTAWFSNGRVQESAMVEYTKRNYTAMISNGAITADMPPEEVSGMMSVAHLLGPNKGTPERPGALGWRQGKGGKDALGTTGDTYFQKGKFAVQVLAPQVAAVDAG
jgi:hypothetical protein